MNKLYYAGIILEEDLGLCEIFDELEQNPLVNIYHHGRDKEIVEMKYVNNYNSDREETGKTHVGFEFHFICFEYKGVRFHIEPASFYPFRDENDPGLYNFIAYVKVGKPYEREQWQQASYSEEYHSITDIDKFLMTHTLYPIRGTHPREEYIDKLEMLQYYGHLTEGTHIKVSQNFMDTMKFAKEQVFEEFDICAYCSWGLGYEATITSDFLTACEAVVEYMKHNRKEVK